MSTSSQSLVVSNPPHGAVDPHTLADLLGVSVDDVRPKLAFWAPEVLSASDAEHDVELLAALRGLGMDVSLIDAAELATVPWPRPVESFSFEDDGLVARFATTRDSAGEDVEISYDEPVFLVQCRPPAGFVAPEDFRFAAGSEEHRPGFGGSRAVERLGGVAIAEANQWSPVLDLYFERDEEIERLTVSPSLVPFLIEAGMPDTGAADATDAVMSAIARRFRQVTVDSRLRDVWPRQPFHAGADGLELELRKLFSYGTLMLRQALQSASPELGDLPQYELGSRMAFVLAHRPWMS